MEPRQFIVVWSVFVSILSSGCVFGWPAMKEILEEDGVYRGHDATERKARFAQIFTAGFFTLIGGRVAMGYILDTRGPRACSCAGLALVVLGSVLFSFSDEHSFNAFAPGLALMGFGGSGVHIANFHISNLFPERKGSIIASYSAAFAGSAIMFPLFRLAQVAGMSRQDILLAYSGVLCLLLVANVCLFPSSPFPLGATVRFGRGVETLSVLVVTASDAADKSGGQGSGGKGGKGNNTKARPMKSLKGTALKQQLGDMQCVALALWFSFGLLMLQFYVANVEYQMQGMTADAQQARAYTELFRFAVRARVAVLCRPPSLS